MALEMMKVPLRAAIFCIREQLRKAQTWVWRKEEKKKAIVRAFETRIIAHVPLHFIRK